MAGNCIATLTKSFLAANLLLAATAMPSIAGDTRGYVPAPPGTTGVLFYYWHSSGNDRDRNGDKVATDFNLDSNLQILRPVYYSSLASMPVTVEALIPFGDTEVDGASVGNQSFSASGLADPTILAGIWPISNSATKTWLGVTEWFKFPIGEYENDRVLNMGANQWAFKTEVGFVKGWGDFYLELTPWVEFYTDNTDYVTAGATLEKDPIYGLETHLSYDISKAVLVSLDHYYKKGAATMVAAVGGHER